MTVSWWRTVEGGSLAQGDLLPGCLLPVFAGAPPSLSPSDISEQEVQRAQLIVVTQSCDLENNRVTFVALCPVSTLTEFEGANPDYAGKGQWEQVRKGRVEGLHLLSSPTQPQDNRKCLVVDFGHIVSLPLAYLGIHANSLGTRYRLSSPFLEHFSQSFARFFMRVGLPSSIPAFR